MSQLYLDIGNEQVEAEQLTHDNAEQLAKWCNGAVVEEIDPFDDTNRSFGINMPSLGGHKVRVSEDDYVVRHPSGVFYVFKPNIFANIYREKE